jgi:hypothetical protein
MQNTVNKMPLVIAIAMVCHAANKAWCIANNDHSQKNWDEADQWQRDSAIKGVEFRLNNPFAGPDAQHNAWSEEKISQGWVYGEEKDAEKKIHPCLVPFSQLPEFQQKKDKLFVAIVDSISKAIPTELTFGQKAVGLTFNPSGNPLVNHIKQKHADVIDILHDLRSEPSNKFPSEIGRHASVAITENETAQMRAVKAVTWVD